MPVQPTAEAVPVPAKPERGWEGTAAGDETGMTLIELLVAMFIFSVLATTAVTTIVTVMGVGDQANHRFANTDDAQPAMEMITKDLRVAQSIVGTPTGTSVTVNANLGVAGGATTVTFTLASTGVLTATSVQPQTSGGTKTSTLQLSTRVVYPSGSATPLFRYYDSNGNAISPVTSTNASQIASISVYMVDNDAATRLPGTSATLTAQIWLRNVLYGNN
jgi:prepilin-type N-terminal cleavage/methylation domain-containing protein